MKDLLDIRKEWEKGLEAKSVLFFPYKTVVILYDANREQYQIHRYFTIGEDWQCSVDYSFLSLDKVFEVLEDIVK